MRAFIKYAGGKHNLAKRYGPPRRPVVVEPFAGGANYSVYWNAPKAILIDKNEELIAVWRWLIAATHDDIMDLDPDLDDIRDCDYPDPVKHFIAWNFGMGDVYPRPFKSEMNRGLAAQRRAAGKSASHVWGREKQAAVAKQIHRINAWEAYAGDYAAAPAGDYHYHVDPPYQKMGDGIYKHSGKHLDFAALAEWCKAKQCIDVCEGQGADWLPFEPLCSSSAGQANRQWTELLWRQDTGHPLLKKAE